jgi:hypothetical protein
MTGIDLKGLARRTGRFPQLVDSRSGVIWHFSPLFRLLPSSGYFEQMLRERSRAIEVARLV